MRNLEKSVGKPYLVQRDPVAQLQGCQRRMEVFGLILRRRPAAGGQSGRRGALLDRSEAAGAQLNPPPAQSCAGRADPFAYEERRLQSARQPPGARTKRPSRPSKNQL